LTNSGKPNNWISLTKNSAPLRFALFSPRDPKRSLSTKNGKRSHGCENVLIKRIKEAIELCLEVEEPISNEFIGIQKVAVNS
jgi:hypothetical protein